MILLDMGWQASQIANFGAIVKPCNCFGAMLVLFLFQNGISVNICIKLVGVIIGLLLISAKTYSLPLFLCLNVFPVIIYSLIDVSVEKNFEYVSDKKIRGTAVSFSSTVASLFAVLCNLLVGFVAEINNYKTAFQVFAVIMFLLIAVIFLFELKIKNNEPENIVHC
jgi:sugar phosphate permease